MDRWDDDTEDASLLVGPKIPWDGPWTAREVIDALEPFATPMRMARVREAVERRIGSVTVVLDAPHDPHNGAAVLRSADAFGLPEMHVVLRDESFRVGRTVARGAEHWVDVVVHDSPETAIERLRDRNFALVATHPRGELTPQELAGIPRVALILGNEHDGVREALERASDHRVRIPMRGFVESLNVSVAAGVLLHAATAGRAGDLGPEERRLLYAKALFRSVQRAADILRASEPGLLQSRREVLPRGGRSV
jgi:tRNA (guanosine-2'-O-)-methyltransferase